MDIMLPVRTTWLLGDGPWASAQRTPCQEPILVTSTPGLLVVACGGASFGGLVVGMGWEGVEGERGGDQGVLSVVIIRILFFFFSEKW